MRGDRGGGFVVERGDDVAIACTAAWQLGGDRIAERQLNHAVTQMLRNDRAGMTRPPRLGEMRDHIGFAERAHGLERQQFRIARPDADAQKFSCAEFRCAHRPGLASALTAAAAIALPPMRPRTMRNGTPCGSAASACLDSAAPTKPTGTPRMAAGFD